MRERIIKFPQRKPFSELSLPLKVKAILSLNDLPMTSEEACFLAGAEYKNLTQIEQLTVDQVFQGEDLEVWDSNDGLVYRLTDKASNDLDKVVDMETVIDWWRYVTLDQTGWFD